jgi:hypothetical protein
MKVVLGLLIFFVVLPATAFSHAEIFFPKLLSAEELSTTGIVLLNVDPVIATIYVYLLSPDGSVVSSTMTQIPPGGQMAKLANELFPGAASGGWVGVITDTEGMQAFWLTYDGALTYMDGAEAAQYENTGADQIIPLIAGDTELNVVCLSGLRNPVPITIRLFGPDGDELAPASIQNLPNAGAFQAHVADMFPSADIARARYVRIRTSGPAIASTALIKKFLVPGEAAVVNGVNVSARTEMNFPHVVNGALTGANYSTLIGVINASNSPQTVTITFNPAEGSPIVATRDLTGNGALRETAQSLFGLSSEFQTGWVRVSGSAQLTGFAAYADSIGGGFAVVPATASQSNLFFSHIADGPPQWQTGLALLNNTNTPANVEVYAVSPSGSLIGKTTLTVDPGKEIANVIHELIPETRGVNGGFVYVRTTNAVPLFGIELFYTEDVKVLSNVAAGKLAPGLVYVPPSQ